MLTFLHSNRLQAFDNSGLPLNGGKLYFYELGTTTPKSVYLDVDGATAGTNPIILDSAGTAEVYLFGSYTIWTFDKNDIQIGTSIDIKGSVNDVITGGIGGNFADNLILSVSNYNDLRAIDNAYSLIWVQGRETQSDGGQGLFYFDINNSETDDDGITITSTVGNYVRYNILNIDPRWFGLVYDNVIDQSSYLLLVEKASDRYKKTILIDGIVFLGSNYSTSISYDSVWQFSNNAKIQSSLSVTMTFKNNVRIIEIGNQVFENFVQPKFEELVLEKIKYSYFNADDEDGRMAKCLLSTSANYFLELDKTIDLGLSLIVPDNFILEINSNTSSGTIYFNTNSTCNLYIPKLKENYENIIRYQSTTTVGSVNVGNDYITPEFFCHSLSGNESQAILAALKNGKTTLKKEYILLNNIVALSANLNGLTDSSKLIVSADFAVVNLNVENVNIENIGNLTGTYFNATNCCISGIGNYVFDTTTLKNVISNSKFVGNLSVEDCIFEDMISYTTYLTKAKNTKFGKLECILNGAEIIDIEVTDPVFYINFDNTIKNSILKTSKEIHYMSKGVGGSLTISNSELFNIVPSDNSYTKYYINNCVGNFIETNSIIDSKIVSATSLGSTILTSGTSNFIAVSGNTSGSYTTISNNLTTNSNFIIFGTSGNYDYIDTTSATKILIYNSSTNDILKNFKLYGGKVNIETQNTTSSDFKICFVTPDFRIGTCNIKSSGSISGNSNKIFNQTFKINSDTKMSQSFWNGISNIQLNLLSYPKTLSDRFSTYSKSIINENVIIDDNFQVTFYGFIAAGTKIKIEIEANIPQTQETFETYYKEIEAKENTRETIINLYDFISSGTNYVSDKWISSPEFTKDLSRIYIKGTDPTFYINSRQDSFKYTLSEGVFDIVDPDAYIYGYWTYKKELLNSGLLNDNIYINLNVKTSGDSSGFYIPSLIYTSPTQVYTSGYYTINSEETMRNPNTGSLNTIPIQRRIDVFPDKYEKFYGSKFFQRMVKYYFE